MEMTERLQFICVSFSLALVRLKMNIFLKI